jgi:predicted DCC family thiol-disulfide oxidoreductase YuxK
MPKPDRHPTDPLRKDNSDVSAIEGRKRSTIEPSVRVMPYAMVVAAREPLILYDGVCNLCNAWVRFVTRRDPTGVFRFGAQQSSTGQAVIKDHMRDAGQLSSVILIEDNAIHTESDAVLRVLARLGPPWTWLALLGIIPRPVHDACYRFVVRHR